MLLLKKYSNFIVGLLVFIIYFLYGIQFNGPSFFADELGYLNNATFIAGYISDTASSYHAGFSLFIAPILLITNNLEIIWIYIMCLNAFFWMMNAFFSVHIMDRFFENLPTYTRLLVLLAVFTFPSWIGVSAYAFAQSLFCLSITLTIYYAIKCEDEPSFRNLCLFSLFSGLTYWVHIIGVMIILSSIVFVFSLMYFKKNFKQPLLGFLVHILIVIFLLLSYKIFHIWMNNLKTPDGLSISEHYPSIWFVLSQISFYKVAVFFTHILGKVTYLIIATFGLIVCFIDFILKGNFRFKYSLYFIVLSLVALIIISAINFMLVPSNMVRSDHWVYGRYQEGILLPILLIALAHSTTYIVNKMVQICIFIILVFSFILHSLFLMDSVNFFVIINVLSYWPRYVLDTSFLLVTIFAGFFCIGFLLFSPLVRLIILILSNLLLIYSNYQNHLMLDNSHFKENTVKAIKNFLSENIVDRTCINIESNYNFYKNENNKNLKNILPYYFFEHEFSRSTYEDWKKNSCNFFISNTEYGVQYLMGKSDSDLFIYGKNTSKVNYSDGLDVLNYLSKKYLGCFNFGQCLFSKDFNLGTNVGIINLDKTIVSQGKEGMLLFGPYKKLERGKYKLQLYGITQNTQNSWVDIHSNNFGQNTFWSGNLPAYKEGKLIDELIELEDDISDIELRIYVGQGDEINFHEYSLIKEHQRVKFNQHYSADTGFFGFGWSHSEETYRWSSHREANLYFSLDEPQDLLFTLDAITLGEQKVVIKVNQQVVWQGIYLSTPLEIIVPKTALLDGNNRIDFDLPDAHQTGNGDERLLGIAIRSFLFTPMTTLLTKPLSSVILNQAYTADTEFFGFGWSHSEETHRWSNGYRANIIFSLDEAQDLLLNLDAVTLGEQNVVIKINQHIVWEGVYPNIPLEIMIPKAMLLDGNNRLDFDLPDAHQTGNGDARLLGIAIRRFMFTAPKVN